MALAFWRPRARISVVLMNDGWIYGLVIQRLQWGKFNGSMMRFGQCHCQWLATSSFFVFVLFERLNDSMCDYQYLQSYRATGPEMTTMTSEEDENATQCKYCVRLGAFILLNWRRHWRMVFLILHVKWWILAVAFYIPSCPFSFFFLFSHSYIPIFSSLNS